MDDRKLKESLSGITMPEDMQARIIRRCQEQGTAYSGEEAKTRTPRAGKKLFKGAVAAAVVCLCSVTALAVGLHTFYNPSIVADREDILFQQPEGDQESGAAVTSPVSGTPPTLADMTEVCTTKSSGWTSEDTMGGTVGMAYHWVSMDVVTAEGPVRSRQVYADNGAVKTEYTAENPADLNAVASDYIHMDLSWLNEQYRYIPNANFCYTIEDKDGEYAGECFEVLYAAGEEGAWFTLSYERDPGSSNADGNSYLVSGDYDEVFAYTTADGFEFVIQIYGDCVWASSATEHSTISLYGGFMSRDAITDILDHLNLYAAELAE